MQNSAVEGEKGGNVARVSVDKEEEERGWHA